MKHRFDFFLLSDPLGLSIEDDDDSGVEAASAIASPAVTLEGLASADTAPSLSGFGCCCWRNEMGDVRCSVGTGVVR